MKKAVFLDRDGVINESVWRDDKATGPRELYEWLWGEGVHDAVIKLKEAGFLVFVITNQPDVHRKILRQEMLKAFHQKIHDELDIDELAVCFHDDEHNCHCRKPKPGMLLDLAKKWDVSLKDSYIIGDTIRDMQAGEAAGVFRILLDKDYNQGVESEFHAKNLSDAVKRLLKH